MILLSIIKVIHWGVKANNDIGIYSDSSLKNLVGRLAAGESTKVISYVSATNGNPPVLEIDGAYITAELSETTVLNRFNIQYDPNGGTGNMENTIVPYGINTKLSKNQFTNKGYKFAGWNVYRTSDKKWIYYNAQTGDKKYYLEGSQPDGYEKMIYRNGQNVSKTSSINDDTIILYAQWTPITYTIVYNSNGGTGTMSNTTITYGVLKAISANKFKKSGYTFNGWTVKRSSDEKWLYGNTSTGKRGWYKAGSQPSGYSKYIYNDKVKISRTSSVDKDTVTFYAQ